MRVANVELRNFAGAVAAAAALVPQLSRYGLVSAVALTTDFAIFAGLTSVGGMRAAMAAVVSYLAGMLLHYALSRAFVFDAAASAKSDRRMFAEFLMSGLFGLVLTTSIIAVATELLAITPILAKAWAAVVSFVAVYALRRTYVFGATR